MRRYRHYHTGALVVVHTADAQNQGNATPDSCRRTVVYMDVQTQAVYTRPYSEFYARLVGVGPRYVPIEPVDPLTPPDVKPYYGTE